MKQKHLHKRFPSKQVHHLQSLSLFRNELKERAKFECINQRKRGANTYEQKIDAYLSDMPPRQEDSQNALSPYLLSASFNPTQLKGLFFLLLLTSAYAINAADKIKPSIEGNPNKSSSAFKHGIYKESCARSEFATYNKPNITLDFYKGKPIPRVCVENKWKSTIDSLFECEKQKNIFAQFKADIPKLKADYLKLDRLRDTADLEYEKWFPGAQRAALDILKHFSSKQQHTFNVILHGILNLSSNYYLAIYMREYKGGNCGEHSTDSLVKLLNYKMKYGLEMKIQNVFLSKNKPISLYPDHRYILIDSDVSDVTIKQDVKKVGHFLDSMKSGHICDQWNKGYFADLGSDNNGLYRSYAQWDTLEIETVSLNFAGFNTLSIAAQRFICKELSQIGLSVEPKKRCGIFNNVAVKNQASADLVNNKSQKVSG